jgi:hypothetical protein
MILSSKFEVMVLGAFLAEQVMRLHKVYEQLDIATPNGILERLSVEAVLEMSCNISRAVLEPGVVVRIVGTSGMGYVVALALMLFPKDCLIAIGDVVINRGIRQSIIIKLCLVANPEGPIQIFTKENLQRNPVTILPIETSDYDPEYQRNIFELNGMFRGPTSPIPYQR